MPYGIFCPAKKNTITNMLGKQVVVSTPAGYSGLFWGSVSKQAGEDIPNAQEYFRELAKETGESVYEYWDLVSDALEGHCTNYVAPYCGVNHNYQSGFGGDESDGLIDFWTEKPIPRMPPMLFVVNKTMYVMKFEFSFGSYEEPEDEAESENEYEDDESDGYE